MDGVDTRRTWPSEDVSGPWTDGELGENRDHLSGRVDVATTRIGSVETVDVGIGPQRD